MPSDKILQLRQLLAERACGTAGSGANAGHFATGLPALDEIGIPTASLTEIVAAPGLGAGGGLLLVALLHAVLRKGQRVILIDGKSAFAPKSLPPADLKRLLWIRCRLAWEAIKAADLAVRDGNVPLVILLLTLNAAGELRRLPANAWHRLQMLAEKSAVSLLAFTPGAQIGCARLRLSVGGAFPLDRLHICRDELIPDLKVHVERRRITGMDRTMERSPDEELCRAVGA
jgi:hypothetical protein